MKSIIALLAMLVLVLAACTLPSANQPPEKATNTPTQFFPPTLPIALTRPPTQALAPSSSPSRAPTLAATATLSPLPSATALPARTSTATQPPATVLPTAKLTQTPVLPLPTGPVPQNPEVFLILAPGVNSSIVSPVTVSGEADPTFEQNLVVKVTGEDGLALVTKPTTIKANLGKRGPFKVDLAFQINQNQPGRVAVYSTSARDGGLEHFNSVEVQLKSSGTASILRSNAAGEVLVISQPVRNARLSGGKITLQGWSGPVFENALSWVLCGEGGVGKSDPFCGTLDNVLGKGTLMVQAPDAGKPGPFGIELAFKVAKSTNARLAVYFTSPRDGGLMHLASVPLRLDP